MAKLKKGDKIPSFTLTNQHGDLFNIDTIIGKKNLVIYFYPRNETKVCTAQACSFRDAYQDFQDFDCEVIGISADNVKSHISFTENHSLPFILLSDGDKKIRKLFGVSNDLLIIPGRTTYVVNKKGIIIHVFNYQLSAGKHIKESLLALAQ